MLDYYEKLRKEWSAITAAPASFAFATLVVIAASWAAFHSYYASRLEDADKHAGQWKSDADYWKDQASHPKMQDCPTAAPTNTQTPAPQSPAQNVPKRPTPARPKHVYSPTPSQTPTLPQDCGPGASCAMSNGQQGGVTAGTINFGPPSRELTQTDKRNLIAGLTGIKAKISFGYIQAAPDAFSYAHSLQEAFIAAGVSDQKSFMLKQVEAPLLMAYRCGAVVKTYSGLEAFSARQCLKW